jgi:electron transfer flavoprotein alpha subunit
MANVLVFAETRNGALRKVALEAIAAARALADASGGGEVHAIAFGAPGIASAGDQLGTYGADVVVSVEDPGFSTFRRESIAATIAERAKTAQYRAIILGFSAQGRDLGPRLAAKLDAPIGADVIEIQSSGNSVLVKHPAYANKVIVTLEISGPLVVLSMRPGAVAAKEAPRTVKRESMAPALDPAAERIVVKEMAESGHGKLDLGEAPVIVAGGRGLRAAENFKLVEDLAAAFGNAAVGATRAVTDDGWRPHSDQIGQTGRQVSPQLYVAVGISGAIQHLAGMRTSKTIVAINKDREAPIFKVADYGIVGDVLEVVPALTEAVRKAKASH